MLRAWAVERLELRERTVLLPLLVALHHLIAFDAGAALLVENELHSAAISTAVERVGAGAVGERLDLKRVEILSVHLGLVPGPPSLFLDDVGERLSVEDAVAALDEHQRLGVPHSGDAHHPHLDAVRSRVELRTLDPRERARA